MAYQVPVPPWRHYRVGGGQIERGLGNSLRLVLADAQNTAYSDAQLDDYQGRPGGLLHRPPLRLQVRARFSHPAGRLVGTAGFGFWNYPIAWPPALPRALWFFYASPPSDMALALDRPGHGWKAAMLDTGRPQALALLPLAPLLVPLMRLPALYRGFWPPIQRAVGVAEVPLPVTMSDWHDYVIEWGLQTSRLLVDGRVMLADAPSPRGPMCLVVWIDNQYLVVTPQGRFGWGLLAAAGQQWLELADLTITKA